MRTRLTVEKLAAAAQSEFEQAVHSLELAGDYCELVRRTCAENHWAVPQLPTVPDLVPPAVNPLGQSNASAPAADSRTSAK